MISDTWLCFPPRQKRRCHAPIKAKSEREREVDGNGGSDGTSTAFTLKQVERVARRENPRIFVNACDNRSLSVICYAAPYAVMPFSVVVRGFMLPRHRERTA